MVVVDASVAVKWVLSEDHSQAAKALTLREEMAAPPFWLLEAGSVIWKRHRRGEYAADDARELLSALRRIGVRDEHASDDVSDALALATRLAHPIYDCLYLALAIRLDTILVTADAEFIKAVDRDPELAGRARHVAHYV